MSLVPRCGAAFGAALLVLVPVCCQAAELVRLDATSLPPGPLPIWSNSGTLGDFSAEFIEPSVTTVNGVKGVTFSGGFDWYSGPVAPNSVTGNGSRSVIAWLFNPAVDSEETVVGWGRRGGPDGSLSAFFHGSNPTWGAFGGWGSGDVGWVGAQKSGVWTCCAWVYDGATGTMSLYTDGQFTASKVIGPLSTHSMTSSRRNPQPLPIRVGIHNEANGSAGGQAASLTLARLSVRDEALTAAQVAAAFSESAADFGLSAVRIGSFLAVPNPIYLGQATTLSWEVSGASSVAFDPEVVIPPGADSVVVNPSVTTTYTLTAEDGSDSTSASVTVTVDPGVPVAKDAELNAFQDGSVAVMLGASDPNQAVGELEWEVVDAPAHGLLSGAPPALVYAPAAGYSGPDSFTFRVFDGTSHSAPATVSITVHPPSRPPSGLALSVGSIPTSAVPGSFLAHLSAEDPDLGEVHSFELVAGPGDDDNARFSISGSQLISQNDFAAADGQGFTIRVRVSDGNGGSLEQILLIGVAAVPSSVVINEIYYDPPNNARSEFVELHNPTASEIDLSGWSFTSGVDYTFPLGTLLPAGGYLVVAMDPAVFASHFGFAPLGPFAGKLSGQGEKVELSDAAGAVIDEVRYKAEFPWPISATADGASMELIHPSLDNDLGGSWRGSVSTGSLGELTYVSSGSIEWSCRKGTSEVPGPVGAWRESGFAEDASWFEAQLPVGYGSVDLVTINTTLGDMQGAYSSVFARKEFTILPGEIPSAIRLSYTLDDGVVIWINGVEVARRNMDGNPGDPVSHDGTARDAATEGLWYEVELANAASFLVEGSNTIAIQGFNQSLSGSGDFGFDARLVRPAGSSVVQPTPGAENTRFSVVAPPQIRQVGHLPEQPASGEAVTITAKVGDPQGVGAVSVRYQRVDAGHYIPARFPRTVDQVLADPKGERPINPEFENPASWTNLEMFDDGSHGDALAADGVFTAVIPGQAHRTLMRYRIVAEDLPGASVQVPYADDDSLNFAYFVYDGVPDYIASSASVAPGGAGKVWPKELLTSLPVYHWIIREEDMDSLQAYEGFQQFPNDARDNVLAARRSEEWEGAFVYDGVVYDHVTTRLRGGNSRYGDNEGRFSRGKRHYKFKFNQGHWFQPKDQSGEPYPEKWKSLAVSKMFGNKGGNNWGMTEEIGATLWRTFGVPAAGTHWFHFRVIDGEQEAPDQYHGDFWGIQQVVEEYESSFLDSRGITKGNLYKMSDWIWDSERQRRYQSPDMVSDGSEFNAIRDGLHGGRDATWLRNHVDYDNWYRYSAVAEAIRHYDVFPYTEDIRHAMKNLAWHFAPTGSDPTRGVCTFLPYDWDASFGPNWNNGWEHANNALYGWDMSTSFGAPYVDKPAMKLEHRNVLREFRDLVWQEDQIRGLMDDRAAVIADISKADQDRWRNAPVGAGTANDDTLAYKVQDMKNFCFVGWSGPTGPTVGAGGRASYLSSLADNADSGQLPSTPVISYAGPAGHPIDGLAFECSDFADPQGVGTFAAVAWRIGEIEDPSAPGHDPDGDFVMEYTPQWVSGELPSYDGGASVPPGALKPGHTYRARVRMKDVSGRWSHWSAPYQFTTTEPAGLAELKANLMITEIMYHPPGPAPVGGSDEDFEYIELQNISTSLTLDLNHVRFTKGVDFDFAGSAITSLPPGAWVLVVKDLAAFQSRYGASHPVAGIWDPEDNLSNGGERLKLSYGAGVAIHDLTYGDEAPWPSAADGSGPALMLVNPSSAPDHAIASNWTAGDPSPGGSGTAGFAAWLADQGASDPDAEAVPGMSFLMMYALGGDLIADPRSALPVAELSEIGGESYLIFKFRWRRAPNEMHYEVHTSTTADSWDNEPGGFEMIGVPVDHGDGTETVTLRILPGMSIHPVRFARLLVEYEP